MRATDQNTMEKLLSDYGLLRRGWFPAFPEFIDAAQPLMEYLHRLVYLDVQAQVAGAQLLYTLAIINNAGNPTFRLKPELIKLLAETDLPRDMSTELLKLPFEGIFLDIPRGTLRPPLETVQRIFMTNVQGDRFRILCTVDSGESHFVSVIPDGSTIEEAVINTRIAAEKNIPPELTEELRRTWVYEDYYATDLFILPVNAALYITSAGADVREDKSVIHSLHQRLQGLRRKEKRARLEAELRKAKQHKIYICGANIEVPKELTAELTEEGRRLTKRFRVRGHWRNQAHGPRMSERKHIFIAPHWKGPTFAEMLARNYIVKR